MRSRPAFVLLLIIALCGVAPVRAQINVAVDPQGRSVVEYQGWERSLAQTGTMYYRCTLPSCGPNGLVSYHEQGDAPLPPFEAFRRDGLARNERIVAQSNGRVQRIDLVDSSNTNSDGWNVYQLHAAIIYADGKREYMSTARFFDGKHQYSLVSTADEGEPARTNLGNFLPVIMLVSKLRDIGK